MSEDKTALFIGAWNMYLRACDIPATGWNTPTAEYNFDADIKRKHRFDWAFVGQKVAVEIEGNAWNVRGGGRHMQDSDLEKYNIAAAMGWRVFRFSPAMLKRDPFMCAAQVFAGLK
jgi:very-short-patch-repair endonuclease